MNEKTETNIALADPSSEATKIEQTRAIAEVQGALVVAQQKPRSTSKAYAMAMESCKMMALAEKAFFSFPRGGKTVTGESIHLAVELARCWGNIGYGIKELSRDDDLRSSEMQAYAWDLEANTRPDTTFIVPHRRSTRRGVVDLTDVRDVYENNANMGARRVREMIFRVLPLWLVEDAKAACYKTLQEGGGVPIEKRRALCIQNFSGLGVTEELLAEKIGKPMSKATDLEIANLGVAFMSIKRGEINADDFLEGTGAAQLTKELAQASKESPPPPSGEKGPSPDAATALPEGGQQNSPGDGSNPDLKTVLDTIAIAPDLAGLDAYVADLGDVFPADQGEIKAAIEAKRSELCLAAG